MPEAEDDGFVRNLTRILREMREAGEWRGWPHPTGSVSSEPLLIGVREAAKYVGIGRDAAYRLVQSGAWKTVKVGNRRLISREALRKWVEEATHG